MTADSRIISFLKAHEPDLFAFLEKLVLIQSGSFNKEGVDQVARMIEAALTSSSVRMHTRKQPELGNHLVVRSLCKEPFDRQVLVVGHMDTVFPIDTDFNWYREDRLKSYGPGVIDMKGGLVAGIFALKALDASGLLKQIPITFIFNSDEEIGSPSSRELIKSEAANSAFAFVLECGGLENQVVTGRKGNLSLRLEIFGKAGHAAFADQSKGSAVLELAHKIIALESLNDFEKGITVNVGKIDGGIGPNTVPEFAGARIDVRFKTLSDQIYLEEKIHAIADKTGTPHTASNLEVISQRPPMEPDSANRNLFQSVKEVSVKLGSPVKEEFRSGVSDANIIAEQKIPVLDGLGPMGANDHSSDEYMIRESLLQRATLLACSVVECWQRYAHQI